MASDKEKTILQELRDEVTPHLTSLESLRVWLRRRGIDAEEAVDSIVDQINQFLNDTVESEKIRSERSLRKKEARDDGEHTAPPLKRKRKKRKRQQLPTQFKSVDLTRRPRKLLGPVKCEGGCNATHYETWQYFLIDGGVRNYCRYCRGRLLDYIHGRQDLLDFSVQGGGASGNRKR
ncbi:hypothetical protein [Marinobacterium litorale]|uniref:hypothetical protein n=1 Tax=Marinobacterium litorale TaxID=404770 RepID=UPI0004859B2F|nr:hypothetical protein [Marinobacterium litorale]